MIIRQNYRGILVVLLMVFLITACPGNNGDNGSTAPTTYTLQGVVTSATSIAADSDTNDPFAPYASNDTDVTAQLLPNPVMVNGFVSFVGTDPTGNNGSTDRFATTPDDLDVYRAHVSAGQFVSLRVADFDANSPNKNDIDIELYDLNLNLIANSNSVTEFESVAVQTDGDYYITVVPYSGISKYVLSIGSVSLAAGAAVNGWPADFMAGQAIIKQNAQTIQSVGVQPLGQLAGIKLSNNDRGRAALLSLTTNTTLAQASGEIGGVNPPQGAKVAAWENALPQASREKRQTLKLIKQLQSRADVQYAEPNFILKPLQVPNDPYYHYQEHYPQIHLPQAWDITTGTPASGNVIVAVIDTGVFLNHEDLAGQLVPGYDFISDPSISNDGDGIDPNPDDPGDSTALGQSSWHGTHVTGTVAAASNNGKGVAGVSWGAKVMPIRVLGVGGGTLYDINQGVLYAAGLSNDSHTTPTQKADIMNLSLGGGGYSQSAQDAFTAAYNAGVIIVAAAGNSNTSTPSYPASYDGVVSVSAVDWLNNRAPYSNYGATVDVAAPGGDTSVDRNGDSFGDGVLSCVAVDTSGTRVPNYAFYQGTSMASPHVAGVVALMKAVYPALTPSEFDALLSSGQLTNDLGTPGRDDIYGYGLIDAFKAVQVAQNLGGGGTLNAIVANPTSVDFGSATTSAIVTLSALGTPPSVDSVSYTATWLTVTAGAVDTSGVGDYNLTVDRNGLADGSYTETVTFNLSDQTTIDVRVSMRVQSQTALPGNAGHLYVVLFDTNMVNQAQAQSDAVDGNYNYKFSNIPPGQYYVIAGSDVDNDGQICEVGETCGTYPVLNQKQLVNLNQNVTGVDFDATVNTGLKGAAAAGLPQSSQQQGYPVKKTQPTTKQVTLPGK